MEQIMVAGCGAVGVGGRAVLPAVLVEAEVNKVFIGEDGEQKVLFHMAGLL